MSNKISGDLLALNEAREFFAKGHINKGVLGLRKQLSNGNRLAAGYLALFEKAQNKNFWTSDYFIEMKKIYMNKNIFGLRRQPLEPLDPTFFRAKETSTVLDMEIYCAYVYLKRDSSFFGSFFMDHAGGANELLVGVEFFFRGMGYELIAHSPVVFWEDAQQMGWAPDDSFEDAITQLTLPKEKPESDLWYTEFDTLSQADLDEAEYSYKPLYSLTDQFDG